MSKGYLRFLAIVAVLALVTAACGDSGSSLLDEASPTAATGDGGGQGGDDAQDEPGDSVPATIGDLPGVSDDCEALLNVFLSMSTIFTGTDISTVNLNAFNDLPGDLQDDAAVVVNALNAYAEGVQELGIDLSDPQALAGLSPDQQQRFAELTERFGAAEFGAAMDNLEAFGQEECDAFTPLG